MRGERLKKIADLSLFIGLPVAVFVTVLAVFLGERMAIDHQLTMLASPTAVPGRFLPIRVMVLGDLEAPAGPRIRALPVEVTLRSTAGRRLAHGRLDPAPGGAREGGIEVPEDAPQRMVLRAVAKDDGRIVARAVLGLRVQDHPSPAPLVGRMAHATAHFSQGPLELIEPLAVSPALDARIVGGACVPEFPCEILVRVEGPAALVRLSPSPAITVDETPSSPSSGLARVVVRVHGPEAHVQLEASRQGVLIARRPLGLPVALATPGLRIEDRAGLVRGEPLRIQVAMVGASRPVRIEAYQYGFWRRTTTVRSGPEVVELPLPLGRGLYRIQAHGDAFAAAPAASRMVLSGGADPDEAIARLNTLAGDPEAESPEGPDELRFAWAAANLEVGHYELPEIVRGLETDRAALERRQSTLRIAAVIAMVLGLLVLGAVLTQRGLTVARQAQQIMDATGDAELSSRAHRRRTLLSAFTIVAMLLLAFVAAGALIVVRGHLLE